MTSYDEIPYDSFPYAQSHPNRLATIATLFGLNPAPIDSCRVLELGCAAGGNLIPAAGRFPGSQFLGLDLSSRQVADGQQTIERIGLQNIRLESRDLMDARDLGTFDYIICHGVWSWVPEPVRARILAICNEHLAEQGVAFISYNTFPGWHMRAVVREMMNYHCRKFSDAKERIANARGLLDWIVRTVPEEKNAYSMLLKHEADVLRTKNDSYIAHEHLEENNHPMYFYEFEEQASAAGLQYLGEAELRSMQADQFGAEAGKVLGKIAKTVVEYEQYMDFLRNRMFRQTLLVRQGLTINRKVDPDRVMGLRVASPAVLKSELNVRDASEAKFAGGTGMLNTPSPLFKAALKTLTEIWPRSMPFEKLVLNVQGQLSDDAVVDAAKLRADSRTLAANLLDCFTRKFVELHTADFRCESDPGDRPYVDRLARVQAEKSGIVFSGLHQASVLGDVQRTILLLSDGEHSREQLVDLLVAKVNSGELKVQAAGEAVTNPEEIRTLLIDVLDKTLVGLARQGLFVVRD